MANVASTYPAHWEADVVLRDGGVVHVRPIRPHDAPAVERFHASQSAESIYLRFFAPVQRLSHRDLQRFTTVDHGDRVALVATLGSDIVGIARYDRLPAGPNDPTEGDQTHGGRITDGRVTDGRVTDGRVTDGRVTDGRVTDGRAHDLRADHGRSRADPAEAVAEVAFNVSDAHHGRGIGSALLEHLTAAARERGIGRFVADVLPQNQRMVEVFEQAGYAVSHHYEDGVLVLGFDISPTHRAGEVRESREQRAAARSVRRLLHPRAVVVIDDHRTSTRDGGQRTHGQLVAEHLVASGYPGPILTVGVAVPHSDTVLAERIQQVGRLSDLTEPVDLAVLAGPAEVYDDVGIDALMQDCATIGVSGLVVLGAGYAEAGAAGRRRQRHLVQQARAHGMRVIGPSSFGVLTTEPSVRLNASLAPTMPPSGRLGLFTQSAAMGVTALAGVAGRGIGVSSFVSAGNRADVSGNDLMQYWLDDPATSAVGLYLESIGNPRTFSRVARRLARTKPVLVVKSGQSPRGAPPGHAVRPSLLPHRTFDQVLQQAGVIRCQDVHQMFDVAQLVLDQPLPAGPRVAVVTNSGALGALAADACDAWGLEVAESPVIMSAQADAREFREALGVAFSAGVDAVVAGFVPSLMTADEDVAAALAQAAAGTDITCVATFVGMRGVAEVLSTAIPTVPAYSTPEEAVRALALTVRYAQWLARDPGPWVAVGGVRSDQARAMVEGWLAELPPQEPVPGAEAEPSGTSAVAGAPADGRWLSATQATRLLDAFGIRLWPAHAVRTADEAARAAALVGYPVVLKAAASHLRHRADLGAVRLDIATEVELREDVDGLRARLRPDDGGLLVQAMAPVGVGCRVRSVEDPLFGPVVEFGIAGTPIDLLEDVSRRSPPLREADVADLVRQVRAAPLLFGYRGTEPVDIAALEDVLARVSLLADQLPEVAELELDPVVVAPQGAAVLGAQVRIARPPDGLPGRREGDARRLPG
ncbi:MAG: GNAT family N-acetyltransferase [Angustibacter sp.]